MHSPQQFFETANHLETTFNMAYLDNKHIAYFSTGRLPVLAPGTDPSLPTLGTGEYDWQGFLSLEQHPHEIDPAGEVLTELEQQAGARLGRGLGQLLLRAGSAGADVQRLHLLDERGGPGDDHETRRGSGSASGEGTGR